MTVLQYYRKLLLIIPFFASIVAADPSPTTKNLTSLSNMIVKVRKHLNADLIQKKNLHAALHSTEKNIHKVSSQIHTLNAHLVKEQTTLNKLQKSQNAHEQILKTEQTAMAKEIRAFYPLCCTSHTIDFFHERFPIQTQRKMTELQYLQHAHVEKITHLHQSLTKIKQTSQHLHQHKTTLQSLVALSQNQATKLLQEKQSKQNLLGVLNTRIQMSDQQLTKLIAEKHALEKLLQKLALQKSFKLSPTGVPFSQLQGKLPWPLLGKIIMHFGTQIDRSGLKYTGILVQSSPGQTIHVVYPGRVVFADWMQGFGLLMIIDHGNDYMTLYGHNSTAYKQVGEIVKVGDLIASVGPSPDNTPTGLYFEIRHHGHPADPETWLQKITL